MYNKYSPRLNDYVEWKNNVKGWVYFVDQEYITIETQVIPKDPINIEHCSLHKNNRLLVVCYKEQWKELQPVGYRTDKYSEDIIKK
jgi:hypothetical protein